MERDHGIELDRAILALVEERVRFARGLAASGEAPRAPRVEDLVRRSRGALDSEDVRALFGLVAEVVARKPASGSGARGVAERTHGDAGGAR